MSETAPYFHNGSALTLEEVVEHYNHPHRAIDNFIGQELNRKFKNTYDGPLDINRNRYDLFAIKENTSPNIMSLNLSSEQKDNLVKFLEAL